MKNATLSCLLLCALPLGPAALAANQAVDPSLQEPNVMRVYQLPRAQHVNRISVDSRYAQLAPLTAHYSGGTFQQGDEYEPSSEFSRTWDLTEELMTELLGEALEYEGRRIFTDGQGRLVLVGPESMQQQARGILDVCRLAFNAKADLQLDIVRVRSGGNIPPAGILPAEDAAGWLEGQSGRSTIHAAVGQDNPITVDMTETQALMIDADVEVAGGCAISDPSLANVFVGRHLTIEGGLGKGGMFLALSLKDGSEFEVGTRAVNLYFRAGAKEDSPTRFKDFSYLQSYEAQNRSLAVTTFLPDGAALIFHQAGPAGDVQVICLRRVGGQLAERYELPLQSDGLKLVLADQSALAPAQLDMVGVLLGSFGTPQNLELDWQETYLAAVPLRGQFDIFENILGDRDLEGLHLNRHGRLFAMFPAGSYLMEPNPETVARQDALLASWDSLRPTAQLLLVELQASRSEGPDLHASIPLLSGGDALVSLAKEGLRLRDYDVEIASNAAIPDPIVKSVFDGMHLWVHAEADSSGKLLLQLRGALQELTEAPEFESVASLYSMMQRDHEKRLLLREQRLIEADAGGAFTAQFGSGDPGQQLSVRVTRL